MARRNPKAAGRNWGEDPVAIDVVGRGWKVALNMGAMGVAILVVIALVSMIF